MNNPSKITMVDANMNINWTHIEKKRPDIDEIIPCLENAFLLKFPDDFLKCAIKNGGGCPEPGRFDIENEKELRIARLCSLDPRSNFFFRYFKDRINYRAPQNFPIAIDTDNNCLCLDYRQGFPPKLYYQKTDPTIPANEPGTFLCSSFTELLEMLY
jgi:hypothetical protein